MYRVAQRGRAGAERLPEPHSACGFVHARVAPFAGSLNACLVGPKGSVPQQTRFLPRRSWRHTDAEAIQYEEGIAIGCCDVGCRWRVSGQARERGGSDT